MLHCSQIGHVVGPVQRGWGLCVIGGEGLELGWLVVGGGTINEVKSCRVLRQYPR